jgi:hypothetical protein
VTTIRGCAWTLPLLALVCSTAWVTAQGKPDLSGTWLLDWKSIPIPAGATGPGTGPGTGAPQGGSFGESFSAMHDARTLVVTYRDRDRDVRQEFALDGRETRNLVPARRGDQEQHATARWDGAKLVLVSKTPTSTLTRTLTRLGNVLVIDITMTIPGNDPLVASIRYTRGGSQ